MNTFGKYYLNETRNLYEKTAQDILTQIFPKIKEFLLTGSGHQKHFNVNRMFPSLVNKILSFIIVHKKIRSDNHVSVSGSYNVREDNPKALKGMMYISIEIPRNFRSHMLSTVYMKMANAIRHELEHVAQRSDRNRKTAVPVSKIKYKPSNKLSSSNEPGIDKFIDEYEYLNEPSEIEAFAAGMYLQSKKRKISFKDVLDQTIYRFFKLDNKEDFQNLINQLDPPSSRAKALAMIAVWKRNIIEYARKRYPDAIL